MEDSIYTQCSNAARLLAEGNEPFHEADVVQKAATDDWTEEHFAQADQHAPQVLAAMFRHSKVVRFGIVSEEAPLTGEQDYVRKEGKILYANYSVWEPKKLKTPNGQFVAIAYAHDPIQKNGRRKASLRCDFTPWKAQYPTPDEPRPDVAALKREITKLRAALNASDAKIARLERDNAKLRSRRPETVKS